MRGEISQGEPLPYLKEPKERWIQNRGATGEIDPSEEVICHQMNQTTETCFLVVQLNIHSQK